MSGPTFHPSLPDFATTPLRSARKAAQRLGMPSFKILAASWATYRAIMAHTLAGSSVTSRPSTSFAKP